MIKVLLLLINCIILVYLLFRIRIYVEICYTRKADDDNVILQIYIWKKWLHYKCHLPAVGIIRCEELAKLNVEVKTANGPLSSSEKNEQRFLIKTIYSLLKIPARINSVITLFKQYKNIYISFMKELYLSIRCEKFVWKTFYGSDNAALTAIITGSLWSLKSLVLEKMKKRVHVIAIPQIQVIPVYNQSRFEFDFQCIFSIRLGNVINATINLIKHTIRG